MSGMLAVIRNQSGQARFFAKVRFNFGAGLWVRLQAQAAVQLHLPRR